MKQKKTSDWFVYIMTHNHKWISFGAPVQQVTTQPFNFKAHWVVKYRNQVESDTTRHIKPTSRLSFGKEGPRLGGRHWTEYSVN